jgi:hypothetical protein
MDLEDNICNYLRLDDVKKDNLQKQKYVSNEYKKITESIMQTMKANGVNFIPLHDGSFLILKKKEVTAIENNVDFELTCYRGFQQTQNRTVDIVEGKRYLEYKNQMKKKLKIIKEELVRSTTKPIDSILFD